MNERRRPMTAKREPARPAGTPADAREDSLAMRDDGRRKPLNRRLALRAIGVAAAGGVALAAAQPKGARADGAEAATSFSSSDANVPAVSANNSATNGIAVHGTATTGADFRGTITG